MLKINKSILVILGLGILISLIYLKNKKQTEALPIVAITQIIDHNTLDTVRAGLEKGLADKGFIDGKTIKIVYQNANGNLTIAGQIAKHLISLNPKVVVALSTQSAQLLKHPAFEANIPLVFSAVTDPVAAKLVINLQENTPGITGVSDYMPAQPQLQMIKSFLPHLKRLGVIYNPSEVNSVSFLDTMKQAAVELEIEFVPVAINTTAEASSAVATVIGKVDALYFPNDNTAMAAAAAIAQIALKHQLPIFANDLASVQVGVLAALSYDRLAMGAKTAEMVAGLLTGQSTSDFPVTNNVPMELVVNEKSLQQLGLQLPANLATPARLISQ